MKIEIIAAADESGLIGCSNDLPWHKPADMRFFEHVTRGHVCVCGRKTYESLKHKKLQGRRLIVLTKNDRLIDNKYNDVYFSDSVDNLLSAIKYATPLLEGQKLMVLGGAQIYKLFLDKGLVDGVYLTLVDGNFKGDIYFPFESFNVEDFRKTVIGEDKKEKLTFVHYDRLNLA